MVVSSVGAPAKSKTSWGDLGRAACLDLEPGWVSRVTIADVASAAGVSKTAVSFAFNNPERLGQATLERVLGVAQDLGYAPHPAARALSMRRSGTIGVLLPQRLSTVFANPFLGELIQGVGELCEEHDLTLLLVPPLDGSLEGAIRQASVDGFISLGLSPDDRALGVLDRIGIPTVLIDSEGSSAHPAVNVDDQGVAEGAGLRVPDDISVVGFDDVPASAWTNPPLTTVRQPIVEKGRLAARLLIQRMKGRPVTSPAPLSTSLIVRNSTSRARNLDLPMYRREIE